MQFRFGSSSEEKVLPGQATDSCIVNKGSGLIVYGMFSVFSQVPFVESSCKWVLKVHVAKEPFAPRQNVKNSTCEYIVITCCN